MFGPNVAGKYALAVTNTMRKNLPKILDQLIFY